jgi:uncharacterized protein YigA (DUF484 family)
MHDSPARKHSIDADVGPETWLGSNALKYTEQEMRNNAAAADQITRDLLAQHADALGRVSGDEKVELFQKVQKKISSSHIADSEGFKGTPVFAVLSYFRYVFL